VECSAEKKGFKKVLNQEESRTLTIKKSFIVRGRVNEHKESLIGGKWHNLEKRRMGREKKAYSRGILTREETSHNNGKKKIREMGKNVRNAEVVCAKEEVRTRKREKLNAGISPLLKVRPILEESCRKEGGLGLCWKKE